MVIYMTTNLINGKKYIGRDSKNNPNYIGSGHTLLKAIKKYGKQNFKKEILEECKTFEELEQREVYWLNYYDAGRSEEFYNMHNHSSGGSLGMNISDETKEKLRRFNLGKQLSTETRERMSISRTGEKNHFFGKSHSEESRKKIRDARRNQVITISEETKKKISDAQKGKARKKHTEESRRKISESVKQFFESRRQNVSWY